jgi:hypothetical protein
MLRDGQQMSNQSARGGSLFCEHGAALSNQWSIERQKLAYVCFEHEPTKDFCRSQAA